MSDRTTQETFREMMVEEAARDRYLQGFQEWHILGKTNLVSEGFLDVVDEADLSADLAQHYDLQPEEVERALKISESMVVARIKSDRNK